MVPLMVHQIYNPTKVVYFKEMELIPSDTKPGATAEDETSQRK